MGFSPRWAGTAHSGAEAGGRVGRGAMEKRARTPDASAGRVDMGPGRGIADREGRLLWVDDAFCSILLRPRGEVVGSGLAEVLDLDPAGMADAAIGGGLIRVSTTSSAPALRVTPLTDEQGRLWAFVAE